MSTLKKKIRNYFIFILFRVRIFTRKKAKDIAVQVLPGQRILEIGSGKKGDGGLYYFSSKKYFNGREVEFITSDFNPNYGHRVVDVVNFYDRDMYDHILCFHVLDDVYEWQTALLNLYKALKSNGHLHIILPVFCGLDYEVDLFRFTRVLIERFCKENNLEIVNFATKGFRIFPFAYYIDIKK